MRSRFDAQRGPVLQGFSRKAAGPSTLPRHGVRFVLGITAGGLLAIALLASVLVVGSYRREIDDTKRQLATFDALLAEETTRAFQNVNLVLEGIVQEVRRDGIETPERFASTRQSRETFDTLTARTSGLPQLDAITIIASDGRLINFSRYFPTPQVNVSDRDYFKALSAEVTDRPYLSLPVQNRGSGKWTIYLARRVSAPDGGFLGLVLGAVELSYFDTLYGSLGLEKGMALSLWRRDGTLLARYPRVESIGRRLTPKWMSDIPRVGTGAVYESGPSVDRHSRIVAARGVAGFDAVVNASITHESALAGWRTLSIVTAFAALLMSLAMGLVALLLVKQFRTYDALAAAVADRERAVERREEAEGHLRQAQKMEAVGHLTGGIAHDFNNMLAIVVGSLDVLRRRMARGERDLDRFIDSAMEGAGRAASLTQRLLAFSRQQPLKPRIIEVDPFLNGLNDLFSRTLGRSFELRISPGAGGWRAEVDGSQLENALLNLALNARDAMPDGGTLSITSARETLGAEDGSPAGEFVALTVSDTGSGMPPEVVARVFEPFFTTKEVGRGTGLGLSQVYGFVAQSGGRISIESRVGTGTSVTVRLPRSHALLEGEDAHEVVPRARHAGETILVVDDEDGVRVVASEMLSELGYTVVQAGTPEAALLIVDRLPGLNLLFTDIVMPGMDGYVLAREVCSRRPSARVLYTTGFARDAFPGTGADADVVPKPFEIGTLARAVRHALDGAPASVVVDRLAG